MTSKSIPPEWLLDPSRPSLVLRSEFAGVRLWIDHAGRGPRLRIHDLETDMSAFFDPLEVSCLCLWPEARRHELLTVGPYDPTAPRPRDGGWEM
jgi:hypothetical protein